VELEKSKTQKLFCLVPFKSVHGFTSTVLGPGRYLVGRTESCDIIIPTQVISSVHAVIEVTPNIIKVFDMNSKNGSFVDGKKIVTQEVLVGQSVSFGNIEFKLQIYGQNPDLPPVLDSLDPISGQSSLQQSTPPKNISLPEQTPTEVKEDDLPYIVYPLAMDPKSDYSEYIFEDTAELYPIFKYELNKQAFEVIILHSDKVYSVDYLPEKNGVYKIAGLKNKNTEIEFPYLAKSESVPFIEVQKGNCVISQLHNYKLLHLTDKEVVEKNTGTVNLQDNDIVKLINGDLEIYIRKVSSPPIVKAAPFFRRDKELWKYLIYIFLFITLFFVGINFLEVDEKLEDEKDPERIATILYKQKLVINKNRTVESTEKKPVEKQTAPKKEVVEKSEPKKTQATSQKSNSKSNVRTPNPGATKAEKTQKVKIAKDPIKKSNNPPTKTAAASKANSNNKPNQARRSNTAAKTQGHLDVYKSFDFKSSVSNLMAKSGGLTGAKTAASSSDSISNASISGGVATNIQKASSGTQIGSLTGSTIGKLAESKGTEGLSAKSGVYTAGIPSETIVLGSMDPDVIRRILRDNIPFFRSCYQKELDTRSGSDVSGTIKLVFTIGASGHVSRAGVDGQTRLPGSVKGCVINVLRGIKFPQPMGGGTVDVKQPFNFLPKRL